MKPTVTRHHVAFANQAIAVIINDKQDFSGRRYLYSLGGRQVTALTSHEIISLIEDCGLSTYNIEKILLINVDNHMTRDILPALAKTYFERFGKYFKKAEAGETTKFIQPKFMEIARREGWIWK